MRVRTLLLAAALALGGAACGNDGGSSGDDDDVVVEPGAPDAAVPEPQPEDETFKSFVIDQISNQTANDTEPVSVDDFASLDDPDFDNPAAYDSLFR